MRTFSQVKLDNTRRAMKALKAFTWSDLAFHLGVPVSTAKRRAAQVATLKHFDTRRDGERGPVSVVFKVSEWL